MTRLPCNIDGCSKPQDSRGWCSMHYYRWRRHGDPGAFHGRPRGLTCSVEGCSGPRKAEGLCRKHLRRWRKHGTTDLVTPPSPQERFWAQVDTTEDCWVWGGASNPHGYGQLHIDGRLVFAHRFSYELHHGGPIPDGMHVCHSCDNPPCVNPDHLWLGTHLDNMRDMQRKGRAAWQQRGDVG